MSLDDIENIKEFSFEIYGKTVIVERVSDGWKVTHGNAETTVVGRDVRTYIAWAKNGTNLKITEE